MTDYSTELEEIRRIVTMSNEDYAEHLIKNEGYVLVMPKGDYWYGVHRFLFTWAIIKGCFLDRTGYEDRWCYSDRNQALMQLGFWHVRDNVGEPEGWHRHPKTGRRRPGGDPNAEYVEF